MTDALRIIPLGGVGEVGKNITVIEAAGEILVIDCGLAFPEPEMLGIDLVIPDVTYLEENRDRVRATLGKHAENISGAGTTSDGAGLRGFEYDYRQGRARGSVIVRTSGADQDFYLFLFVHEFDARD